MTNMSSNSRIKSWMFLPAVLLSAAVASGHTDFPDLALTGDTGSPRGPNDPSGGPHGPNGPRRSIHAPGALQGNNWGTSSLDFSGAHDSDTGGPNLGGTSIVMPGFPISNNPISTSDVGVPSGFGSVPTPGAVSLLGLGGAIAFARRRRR